jgi:hypothetical protein
MGTFHSLTERLRPGMAQNIPRLWIQQRIQSSSLHNLRSKNSLILHSSTTSNQNQGAMLGFVLARFSYLDIDGMFHKSTAPSEWLIYRDGLERYGITIHLSACLPAGFLMVWQFLPIIRHKFLIFHRINGYIVILLVFVSNAGALMIAKRAFGGTLLTQMGVGVLAIMITISISMAYYNIKRLQIDQHRAWMLRTMFYMGMTCSLDSGF